MRLNYTFSIFTEKKARNKFRWNRDYQDGHAHSVRRLAVLPDNLGYLRVRPPSEIQPTKKSESKSSTALINRSHKAEILRRVIDGRSVLFLGRLLRDD